jgi:hypothetical protein
MNHIPVDNLASLLVLLAEVDASSISNRLLLAAGLHLDNGNIHHHDDEHEEDAREEAHGGDAGRGAALDLVGEGAGDDLNGALLGRAGAVDPLTSFAVAEIAGRKGAHFDCWGVVVVVFGWWFCWKKNVKLKAKVCRECGCSQSLKGV